MPDGDFTGTASLDRKRALDAIASLTFDEGKYWAVLAMGWATPAQMAQKWYRGYEPEVLEFDDKTPWFSPIGVAA